MNFSLNRRLLRNNCLLFIYFFVLLQSSSIVFFHIFRTAPAGAIVKPSETLFDALQPFHYPVSCEDLFKNISKEFQHVQTVMSTTDSATLISDEQYSFPKDQCQQYRSERFSETFHRADNSRNEQFPLAFSLLMHENVEQFERLLRLIYRPQNLYCIHVDASASDTVLRGVQSVAQCFDNVFLSRQQEDVLYGTFSRLQADLNCMADLIEYPSWKYLLNMANSELPLKTNSELVEILSIYRGFNDLEGRWKTRNKIRTDYVWERKTGSLDKHAPHLTMTREKKSPPPGNLEIVKGSAYGQCLFFFSDLHSKVF